MIRLLLVLLVSGMQLLSYNVENFFHPANDSLVQDDEFTPQGHRRWGYRRYYQKIHHIAQVVAAASESTWSLPAIVALQEVENDTCLMDLCRAGLRHAPYGFVHFDGPDPRGIDVALLYDTTRVHIRSAHPLSVVSPDRPIRDILYVETDDLHLFVCHLPSQLGGASASASRRDAAKAVLRAAVDSILRVDSLAAIVVMGDMNTDPRNDLLPLINLMPLSYEGTEKYHGQWAYLDQFYVSPALLAHVQAEVFAPSFLLESDPAYLGFRPRRTFQGYRYSPAGYSDHLPIRLIIDSFMHD